MDVSGQSMLPMAGLAVLVLPGWWKLGALIVILFGFFLALNRLVFHPHQGGARHPVAPRRSFDPMAPGRHRAR